MISKSYIFICFMLTPLVLLLLLFLSLLLSVLLIPLNELMSQFYHQHLQTLSLALQEIEQ